MRLENLNLELQFEPCPFLPDGAECMIDGLYHKVGLHGKLYKFNGVEWTLSSKGMWRYHQNIKAMEKKGLTVGMLA